MRLEKAVRILGWAEEELSKYGVLGYSAIDIERVREQYLKAIKEIEVLSEVLYEEAEKIKDSQQGF
jgi:hypothetical protein